MRRQQAGEARCARKKARVRDRAVLPRLSHCHRLRGQGGCLHFLPCAVAARQLGPRREYENGRGANAGHPPGAALAPSCLKVTRCVRRSGGAMCSPAWPIVAQRDGMASSTNPSHPPPGVQNIPSGHESLAYYSVEMQPPQKHKASIARAQAPKQCRPAYCWRAQGCPSRVCNSNDGTRAWVVRAASHVAALWHV